MFKGSITALITPFRDGKVDEKAFQSLVDWQIEEGTDALVPCGTTGESPTLSHDEHHRVVDLCIEAAHGRVPVIAGAGSNSTEEAISLTRHAKKAGATATLHVVPYYNKPTQEGMYQHFKAINDAVELPIIIYNIPGRVVVEMNVETMARLGKLPNIVGVKDSTGDVARVVRTRLANGEKFAQLTGEDANVVGFLAMGGHGAISVTSNIAPGLCARLHDAWAARDLDTVAAIRDRLAPLNDNLFCETNPAPVKYAASLLGKCAADLRLPMVELSEASKQKVQGAMRSAGLIN